MTVNRVLVAAAFVLSSALGSSVGLAQVIAGPIVNPANGHEYFLLAPSSWAAAEGGAVVLGGHLVTVNDAAENDWILTTFAPFKATLDAPMWIGFNDAAVEGSFVWSSGETPGFTAWAPGEPNDGFGAGEDYAFIYPHVALGVPTWNDSNDVDFPFYGVVERHPPVGVVTIDVKPGSYPNSINLRASGVIPVAILSTATFDAPTEVDPDSLSLAGSRVRIIGRGSRWQCGSEDVNADGRLDLVCHFTNDLNGSPGNSVIVLEGKTFGGMAFAGSDTIRILR